MVVLARAKAWDVALLAVDHASDDADPRGTWLAPASPSPVAVQVGMAVESDCEAVGFPRAELRANADGGVSPGVRQSEQASGTLRPAGQGKAPVSPDRKLPKRWLPLDADSSSPDEQQGWSGMSGAGVVLADGRLVGIVVAAEQAHQNRRLYVVPLADVISDCQTIADAFAELIGTPIAVESRHAPLWREVLKASSLGPDGLPLRVADAPLEAFGVKRADVPGEPPYLPYTRRDDDDELLETLRQAIDQSRMMLVVGGSAAGKSRSSAEAARSLLAGHRLVVPTTIGFSRLLELSLDELGDLLVWLDDVERYEGRSLRDVLDQLLHSHSATAVGTIRRRELELRQPTADIRDPLGEALAEKSLVLEVSWPTTWKEGELARLAAQISCPPLLEWIAKGGSPSAWVVAGPALLDRLRRAKDDDEHPWRYALVRAALDWYRTGLSQSLSEARAAALLPDTYLGDPGQKQTLGLEDALAWALAPVIGAYQTAQSLLRRADTDDGLAVHDFVYDDDMQRPPHIPEAIWLAALETAATPDRRLAVSIAAFVQGNMSMARAGFLPLAELGDARAMTGLGNVLADTDPMAARHWYEEAARLGSTAAMYNLGQLLEGRDLAAAVQWYEQATRAGHKMAMGNFLALVSQSDSDEPRKWLEQAATSGVTAAMINLGILLEQRGDPTAARHWLERAARAGDTYATVILGRMLRDTAAQTARNWLEQGAQADDTEAMNELGWQLAVDGELATAQGWFERAARSGDTHAMRLLGRLLRDTAPIAARHWLERATEMGDYLAMNDLGVHVVAFEPEVARFWWERAAQYVVLAEFNLRLLAETKTAQRGDPQPPEQSRFAETDVRYNT
jgi:TPR repeat protein